MRRNTAIRAATRSVTCRPRAVGDSESAVLGLGRIAAIGGSTRSAARGRWPHGRGLGGQGLGHRPLGDDGRRARSAVPGVSRRLSGRQ